MNLGIEPWSEEVEARLAETSPVDFSADFRSGYEAGHIFFLVARHADGWMMGVAAIRICDGPELEVVGINFESAPFLIRSVFKSILSQADVLGARVSCMVEREAMEKIVKRFDLVPRATLFVREAS